MKKIVLIVFISLILVFTAGCLKNDDFIASAITPKPVYEMIVTKEDGMSVIIAGATYKELPETKWDMHPDADAVIGYAGSKELSICAVQGDVTRNFICVFENIEGGTFLYRTDITVPEPSFDSVDEIYFMEQDFSKEIEDMIVNNKFTYDKQIIKEYFYELENAEITYSGDEINSFGDTYFTITCTSKEVPGASYRLNLGYLDGEFMCGNNVYGYVKLSKDIIEKLAGYEIDLDRLVRES